MPRQLRIAGPAALLLVLLGGCASKPAPTGPTGTGSTPSPTSTSPASAAPTSATTPGTSRSHPPVRIEEVAVTGIDALFRGGVPVAIVHWRSGVAPCTVYHHAATETTSTRTTLIRIFERLDASLSCPDRVEDKSTEVRLTSCYAPPWMGTLASLVLGMAGVCKAPPGVVGGAWWCPGCRGGARLVVGWVSKVSRRVGGRGLLW